MQIIYVVFLVLCSCFPAISADISVTKINTQFGEKRTIFIQGSVEPVDVGNIIKAIARDPSLSENEYDPNKPQILVIFGQGGDYTSAIEISRIVNATLIRTIVPENEICQGPCALIFMAGAQSGGDDYIDSARCLSKNTQLIFGVPEIATQLVASSSGGQLPRQTRLETLKYVIEFVQLSAKHNWPQGLLESILDQDEAVTISPESENFVGDQYLGIKSYRVSGVC